jgi:hypothetical protein
MGLIPRAIGTAKKLRSFVSAKIEQKKINGKRLTVSSGILNIYLPLQLGKILRGYS